MARFSDLPEELVMEILVWLDVDSLMRSKCVQKAWCSLITNPRFIAKQLSTPIHNKNSCVLLKSRLVNGRGKEAKVLTSLLSLDSENGVSIIKMNIIEFPFNMKIHLLSGHCHGIICLVAPSGTVILANLAIREFRKLPEPRKYYSSRLSSFVGFGYDPKSNDYKVIRFVDGATNNVYSRVEVYNLSSDSWRVPNNTGLSGVDFSCIRGFDCRYINGFCNWLAFDLNFNYFILSFDMSNEVFQMIQVPDFVKTIMWLMVFNDSLAFVLPKVEANEYYLEMWVMDELSVSGTWRKHLKIGAYSSIQEPLVFWKNDELIIEDGDGTVCSYNLGTQEMKVVPVKRYLAPFAAVIYKSSLVSIKAGNKLDIGALDRIYIF